MGQGQDFNTRSGRVVSHGADGSVGFEGGYGYIGPNRFADAEEFFQGKRDEELGRWRWPENPDYVVYRADDYDGFMILDEREGKTWTYHWAAIKDDPEFDGPWDAARAFFEAHPERKLPTENGVYVPSTADLTSGPLTFVLYGGSWRATPGSDDAAELAREWHTSVGLVRLGKSEDAS